jgi:hypothetical protein
MLDTKRKRKKKRKNTRNTKSIRSTSIRKKKKAKKRYIIKNCGIIWFGLVYGGLFEASARDPATKSL